MIRDGKFILAAEARAIHHQQMIFRLSRRKFDYFGQRIFANGRSYQNVSRETFCPILAAEYSRRHTFGGLETSMIQPSKRAVFERPAAPHGPGREVTAGSSQRFNIHHIVSPTFRSTKQWTTFQHALIGTLPMDGTWIRPKAACSNRHKFSRHCYLGRCSKGSHGNCA
jgi:hypothetical protein